MFSEALSLAFAIPISPSIALIAVFPQSEAFAGKPLSSRPRSRSKDFVERVIGD